MKNNIEALLSGNMRATRLGTCYDGLKRELLINERTFDLGKLNEVGLIRFVKGIGETQLHASSNKMSIENTSAFGASAKAEGGIFGMKLAASFKMEKSQASTKSSTHIEANISYRLSGQNFYILNTNEETAYNCLYEDCQQALDKILTADTASKKFEHYRAFIARYGTHCVTKLHLGAGSISKVTIETESTAVSNASKYEGTLAASSFYGSVSAATGWAEKKQSAGLKGQVKVDGIDYPSDTPTQAWTGEFTRIFAGKGIEKLTESSAFAELPETKFAEAPPYPEFKKPDTKKIPKSPIDITKEMQDEIMKEEGFKGTWKEFEAKQKEALASIDKERIVAESNAADGKKMAMPAKYQAKAKKEEIILKANSKNSDQWNLGYYLPVDFETRPWTEIFPSLKAISTYPSTTNINFAKIVTFYYTRLQFGQYMMFLHDLGSAYTSDNSNFLKNDIDEYLRLCDKYLNDFYNTIDEEITDEDYQYWLLKFKEELDALVRREDFYNISLYNTFFRMYSTFDKCPYGFIVHGWKGTIDNVEISKDTLAVDFYINKNEKYVGFRKFDGMQASLKVATKIYPVIKESGKDVQIGFVAYGKTDKGTAGFYALENSILQDHDFPLVYRTEITEKQFKIEDNYLSINYEVNRTRRTTWLKNLRCVTFENVHSKTILKGATPMFQDFPFDETANFPK